MMSVDWRASFLPSHPLFARGSSLFFGIASITAGVFAWVYEDLTTRGAKPAKSVKTTASGGKTRARPYAQLLVFSIRWQTMAVAQFPCSGLNALLTPEESVLLLIDHQAFQFANLHSHEPQLVANNVTVLAKLRSYSTSPRFSRRFWRSAAATSSGASRMYFPTRSRSIARLSTRGRTFSWWTQ